MIMTTTQTMTIQTTTMLTTKKTKTTTHQTTTTTALCSGDHWARDANGKMRNLLAQRVAKHRQVKPTVDSILRAGNAVQQGALLRGVLDHSSMLNARKMAAIQFVKRVSSCKICHGAISEDDGAELQHKEAAWKYHH